MALRKLTKKHSHFLVRYDEDDELQIRTKKFFRTDLDIQLGNTYDVQWGKPSQSAVAKVLDSGDYSSMTKSLMYHRRQDRPNSPTSNTAESPSPKRPPAIRQRVQKQKTTITGKKSKPLAKSLCIVGGDTSDVNQWSDIDKSDSEDSLADAAACPEAPSKQNPSPHPLTHTSPPHLLTQTSPPHPQTQTSPPHPQTHTSPPHPLTQTSPPNPQTQTSPPHPQTFPPHPLTDTSPPHPQTQTSPPHPQTHTSPPHPLTQTSPPNPQTDISLPHPLTDTSPPHPVTQTSPPHPQTDTSPPHPITQTSPPHPQTDTQPHPLTTPKPHSTTHAQPDHPTHLPRTPLSRSPTDTEQTSGTPVRTDHRLYALINRKIDALNRRQDGMDLAIRRLETKVDKLIQLISCPGSQPLQEASPSESDLNTFSSDLIENIDDPFLDIPPISRLSVEELKKIDSHSTGPGNFAKNICARIFPELYGSDNMRFGFSYFGGGVKSKRELDPTKKSYLERYVLYLYPELKLKEIWKDRIVPKINESLRRPSKK